MSKIYACIIVLFIYSNAFSQKVVTLTGKVIEESNKSAIQSATVYLSNAKDSTVIDYTISDKNGKFEFKIKKINTPVFLKVSFVSFEDFKLALNSIDQDKDIGIITLKDAAKSLNDVVIKGMAPPIRIKKDTLEFNVSSFKVRPDANVETLLKQLPGVEIDTDGKISVNGKEVNQILVNGKPFFDKDGKVALQNLPSDIVNKVQITDTKTKKEEKTRAASSSNSASINLSIDEDKNKGFFGKIMGGKGSDGRYESSFLINYFKNKRKISVLASSNNINSIGFSMDEVFDNMGGGRNSSVWINDKGSFGINGRRYGGGNGITQSNLVGINYSDEWTKNSESSLSYFYSGANSINDNKTNQINFLPSGNFSTNSTSSSNQDRYTHNISSVFEYKLDSLTSIVIEPNFTKSNTKNRNLATQNSFDATNAMLNSSTSDTNNENDTNTFKNTLSFTKSFRKKDKYLSLVFENENGTTTDEDYIQSNTIFYQGTVAPDNRNQFNKSKNNNANYFTELEYTHPITDSLQIKFGLDHKLEKNSDSRSSFNFDATNQSYTIINSLLTNEYNSTESTLTPNAGLVIKKSKINFSFNLGTNLINFDNQAEYLNVNSTLNKQFVLPYVNVYGNYKFTKTKNLWVNYNYNYSLPSARQILPIEDLANPLNTFIGNPDLDLNKSHNLNFNYRNYDYTTKSGYGSYVGANISESQIVSSVTYDANRKRTTTYTNISGAYNSWITVYWNKTIKKDGNKYRIELRMNNNFGLSKGFTDGIMYEAKTHTFSPRINLTYDYGELLTINPSYNYSYNNTKYNNYIISSASNFTHRFNLQVTNYYPKNWIFGNDFGYTYNSNIADGFKKDFFLWNTSLSYGFLEKKLMAKIKVYDLLNQNQSATRTITPTTIRDEENMVLKRYVMFSLTYKLEKFGGKEKKSKKRFNW